MDKLKLGFAMTGSFCTWAKVLPVMEELAGIYDVFPILSPKGAETKKSVYSGAD